MTPIGRALASSIAVGCVLAGTAGIASPAAARGHRAPAAPGAVYVIDNQPTGNHVLRYDRHRDGTLGAPTAYPTGGTGTGGGLGSQGAVALSDDGRYLYVVNAGSDSISSFRVRHSGLELLDTEPSGGDLPTSLTVHGHRLYVLNAGEQGSITGFAVHRGRLSPLPGSTRPLSGPMTAPAQVAFTPDGRRLIVAERATQLFDVYTLNRRGWPVAQTTVPSAGATPFGFEFGHRHHLIVSEAAGGAPDASTVSSYDLSRQGFAVVSAAVPTTETAACWIAVTPDGRYAYAGNADSMSITGYRVGRDGSLTILDPDGRTATAAGTVTDLAISAGGRYLYARLGDGSVGAWAIQPDGSLAVIGAFPGLPDGAAGIAAA